MDGLAAHADMQRVGGLAIVKKGAGMRKACVLAAALIAVSFISGCLGAVQLEEYGYVQSFGIDKEENKKYSYSFLLQNYRGAGQEGSESGNKGLVIGGEGDTLFEALALITAGLPYELNFTRTASVFFSEELARAGEIEQLFSISQSELKMRNSVKLLVVHGNTREFQEGLQVENSPDLLQMQRSILYSFSDEGTVPMTNYAIFYEAVHTGRFDPIVVYGGTGQSEEQSGQSDEKSEGSGSSDKGGSGGSNEKSKAQEDESKKESSIHGVKRFGGMPAYADGTALFNGIKMVGVLNSEETKYLLTARGELGSTFVEYVYDEDQMLVLRILQNTKPKVTLELDGSSPKAKIEIPLVCEIYMDSKGNASRQWESGLREEVENYICSALEGVFETCRNLKCDALGLGKEASKKFSDLQAWDNYNWKARYPQAEVKFDVSITLWDAYIKTNIE